MSFIHDKAIEWYLVACLLKKPDLIKSTISQIDSNEFTVPKVKLLFTNVIETWNGSPKTDTFFDSFIAHLKSKNLLNQPMIELIFKIMDGLPTTSGINNYIIEIKETRARFQIGCLMETLNRNNSSREVPVEQSVEAIISCLNSLDGNVKRQATPSNIVKEYVEQSEGIFSLDDVCKQYRIFDRPGRQAISRVLCRMADNDIIKRESNRNAVFRRIERGVEVVDWQNATGVPIKFSCPLGTDRYANLHRKSIICVGGSKDAGKTSFAENFALMNIPNFKQIRYVTSEMGPDELRDSLQRFDVPLETWNKIEFIERHRDFPDVVLPDGLTIIDFLDVVEDFYLVIKYMKEIYDQIKTGVALVCLQKDPGKDFSRGGAGSEDKARLAIHLKQDYPGYEAKINVGKIWAQKGINPKGFTRRYKLHNDGSRFVCEGGWMSPWNGQAKL